MATLLVVEYIFYSVSFDISPLLKQNSGWRILGYMGTLAPLAVIILTSLIMVSGSRLRRDLSEISLSVTYRRNLFLWVLHIASYIVLIAVAKRIYISSWWLACWAACAVTAGGSALFLALPPKLLLAFVRRTWKILIVGSIVGVLAWAAGLFTELLWNPLGGITFNVVKSLVGFLPGEPVINAERYIIGTSQFSVAVAPICAGYQGVGLMSVFISAYLFWMRKTLRFPMALILLPVALLLVWLTNALRIAALIAIGSCGFPEIALGGFHAKAGWLLFCVLALGIVAVTQRWHVFRRESSETQRDAMWNPTAAYLLPFLIAVAVSMVTGMVSVSSVDLWYPLRIVAAGAVFWLYRRSIYPFNFSVSWFAMAIGIGVGVAWIGLDALFPGEEATDTLPPILASLPTALLVTWLSFRVVGSCVVIPLIEEIAFRGFLLRRFISADFTDVSYRQFTWLSFLASSGAFGLIHGRWFVGIVAGMLFALVVYRRGKLMEAVVAHAISNALIAAYVLFWGKWSLWM